jgi:formiminoglutamase
VISVYINHKKCFAFVELKSIELTTACLELDGIVYRNSVLKVQRANEYKPEAVSNMRAIVKLHLPPEVFSGAVAVSSMNAQDSTEPRLTNLIMQGSMSSVERGAIVLLGFPFDEGSRRTPIGRPGGSNGPKIIRRFIGKLGSFVNPEFGYDIGNLLLIDIGDIPVGLTLDEAHARLALIVAEIIHRGGIPFIIGGSNDMSYFNVAGLMAVAGGAVGVVNLSSQLHVKPPNVDNKIHAGSTYRLLLEDTRFCSPRNGLSSMPSCDGKFVVFGCQGNYCTVEQTKYVTDRNGRVYWLSKDIRGNKSNSTSEATPSLAQTEMCSTQVAQLFKKVVMDLSEGPALHEGSMRQRRPVLVAVNMEAMCSAASPGVVNSSSIGFSVEEMLELCFAAGADPNVVAFDVSEFNPDVEELRTGKLIADMFYYFVLGAASRSPIVVPGRRGTYSRHFSNPREPLHAFQQSLSDPFDMSLLSPQVISSYGLQGVSSHGLQGVSSHSLQGMSSHSLQGVSSHGLQGMSSRGLQGMSSHGLQGMSSHSLQGLSSHGLQGMSSHGLQGISSYESDQFDMSLLSSQNLSSHSLQSPNSTVHYANLSNMPDKTGVAPHQPSSPRFAPMASRAGPMGILANNPPGGGESHSLDNDNDPQARIRTRTYPLDDPVSRGASQNVSPITASVTATQIPSFNFSNGTIGGQFSNFCT